MLQNYHKQGKMFIPWGASDEDIKPTEYPVKKVYWCFYSAGSLRHHSQT